MKISIISLTRLSMKYAKITNKLELTCDDIEADETGDWSNGTNNTS